MYRCLMLFFVLILSTFEGFARKPKQIHSLNVAQDQIQSIRNDIKKLQNDSIALIKHLQIQDLFAELMRAPEAFKYQFDSLRWMGKIYAPKKRFSIHTWSHGLRDGTHCSFGIITIPNPDRTKASTIIKLYQLKDSLEKPEQTILSANHWLPALYYKIIGPNKAKDGRDYYALLGADLNNLKTKKKIIEFLSFSDSIATFGAPIAELNGWDKSRIIFEYSSAQAMYLEYNKLKRRIEFDHLAPLMPYLVGEYEYYEPDQFRDALIFKQGKWQHKKDIQLPPKDKKLRKSQLPKAPPIIFQKENKKEEGKKEEDSTDENPQETPETQTENPEKI